MSNPLLKTHDDYLAQFTKDRIASKPCPSCGKEVHSLRPVNDEEWDTMMICPHCDTTLWKVISATEYNLYEGPNDGS